MPAFALGTPAADGFETVVDHLLGRGDFRRLLRRQITMPAKHLRLE
jgi:hypothetical protein